jgi:hypothetical protein
MASAYHGRSVLSITIYIINITWERGEIKSFYPMKKIITRLAAILTGLPLICFVLIGQTAVKNTAQITKRFDRLQADTFALQLKTDVPEAKLRADRKPWPDSIIRYSAAGERVNKSTYTYNDSGIITKEEYFTWENDKWQNHVKTEYIYSAIGNISIHETYNWENSQWTFISKNIYERDAADNVIRYEYHKGENNHWVPLYKDITEYDSAGHEILYEFYINENNQWIPESKYILAYDDDGNRILNESYKNEDGVWVGLDRNVIAYENSSVRLVSEDCIWENNKWETTWKLSYINEGTSLENNKVFAFHLTRRSDYYNKTWIEVGINIPLYGRLSVSKHSEEEDIKYKTTYDMSGNLIQLDVTGLWNGTEYILEKFIIEYVDNNPVSFEIYNGNELYYKILRQYDSDGYITFEERYQWDVDKMQIVTDSKKIRISNDIGYEIFYEYYVGNESGNGWVGQIKYEKEYDANGKQTSHTYYKWDNGNWTGNHRDTYDEQDELGRATVYNQYEWQSGRWEKVSYIVSYPNALTPDVSESVAADTEVWSYAGSLHVRTMQSAPLNIYTLAGALLTRQTLSAGETVITLPQGIYIIQIGKTTHKIAVTR